MRKNLIRLASTLFPSFVVNLAYKQLTNPQFHKLRPHEEDALANAEKEQLDFQGFKIQLYKWKGEGEESILLIHGWEGQAGNFSDLIQELLQEGYTVYAFDGPSHGASSRGETSMFEFSDLVAILIERFAVSKLISHSFGGVATTYALYNNQHLNIDKYVLLTTPDRFLDRINYVSEQVGITEKVKTRLIKRLEKELDVDVETMNVSDIVKDINVKKALIIHDKNDKVIAINQSQNIAKKWANCELKEIEGTGHFRILRTDFVAKNVLDFLES